MITIIIIENNNNNHNNNNNIITLKKGLNNNLHSQKGMLCFQPLCSCGVKNALCVFFQCEIATHVDTTDAAANIHNTEGKITKTMCILAVHVYHAGRKPATYSESARGAGLDPQSEISHVCTLLCTHLTWRIVCFLDIRLKLQKKETKRRKKRECTALQECPIGLRRFLELTGCCMFLFVFSYSWWLIIIGGRLPTRKWSFIGGLGTGKWLVMGGGGGVEGEEEKASFLFTSSLQWRMKTKKNHPQFSTWIHLESFLFLFFWSWGGKKTNTDVAFSQTLSPRVFISSACRYWS